MKKVDLSIYSCDSQYFKLFDILLKNESITKESFLIEKNITPSSYRRARAQNSKIGKKIIDILALHFDYKLVNYKKISQIESNLEQILERAYYKDFSQIDEDLSYINRHLAENTLLFPVFLLIKLFLLLNQNKDYIVNCQQNIDLYNEVEKYKNFYSGFLQDLFEVISYAYVKKIPNDIIAKEINNPMLLQIISGKFIFDGRYAEAIYFAKKAKELLYKDENYKRITYINCNLMFVYNKLQNYDESIRIGKKQIMALNSYNIKEPIIESTKRHYCIALLAKGEYQKIIDTLGNQFSFYLTELSLYIIAMYKTDLNKYNEFVKENFEDEDLKDYHDYFKSIDNFLINKDKKELTKLQTYDINSNLLEAMKKIY